jgi:hypothetical protein
MGKMELPEGLHGGKRRMEGGSCHQRFKLKVGFRPALQEFVESALAEGAK